MNDSVVRIGIRSFLVLSLLLLVSVGLFAQANSTVARTYPGFTNIAQQTNLYKSFALGERTHFEFRAESYNTFNHTQFNGFHNNISGSGFGEVSGVQESAHLRTQWQADFLTV